jgi:hypothetical protein
MHDIGRLGLLSVEPQVYTKLLNDTAGTNRDMLLAERWAFKIDHCKAGMFLTKTWGLPAEFQETSSQHHAEAPTDHPLDVVRLACALAHALGYQAAPLIAGPGVAELLEQVPGLQTRSGDPAVQLAEHVRNELAGWPGSCADAAKGWKQRQAGPRRL